jgi:hypothetical protein
MEYFIKLVVGVKDFFNHNHTLKIRQSTSGIENEAIYIQTKIETNYKSISSQVTRQPRRKLRTKHRAKQRKLQNLTYLILCKFLSG